MVKSRTTITTIMSRDAAIQYARDYAHRHPETVVSVKKDGVTIWDSTKPQAKEVSR